MYSYIDAYTYEYICIYLQMHTCVPLRLDAICGAYIYNSGNITHIIRNKYLLYKKDNDNILYL